MKKIVVLFLLFVSFQLFGELPTVAVYHFENQTTSGKYRLSDNTLINIEEKLRNELIKTKQFKVMSADTMEAAIAQHKKKSHQLNYDRNYQIELGKTIFARNIVIGKIRNDDGDYTIYAEMIDTETSVSTGAGNADFTASKASRDKASISIVRQLLGEEDEGSAKYSEIGKKKSKEQEACENARYSTGPTAWLTYLDMFPNGSCAAEAKRALDKSLCEHARNENTVEIWQKYLKLHPGGDCEFEARNAIRTLQHQNRQPAGGSPSYSQPAGRQSRDTKACEYAKNENSVEAWQDYLDSFPDGECSFEAKGNIRKLKKEREEQERKAAYLKGRKIGNLIWSDRSASEMNWSSAKQYCENLSEGGYTDWRLPNIDELRTTIKNCYKTEIGGECRVSERNSCLSWKQCGNGYRNGSCYCDDRNNNGGYYSKLGDPDGVYLWSSSTRSDNPDYAWLVGFESGYVGGHDKSINNYVRCVR